MMPRVLAGGSGTVYCPDLSGTLQLFAYHLALARATNPDTLRTDDGASRGPTCRGGYRAAATT